MTRFMSCYTLETDQIEAFKETEDWQTAQDRADEFVWQFATDRKQAIAQHFNKLDEWENDPTKHTY